MVPVSIVIITKNEADIAAGCIQKAMQITDDIVLIVNNILDETHNGSYPGYRVYKETWDGYGNNKNKGIAAAKYDWILSIDADEIPDNMLIQSLHGLNWDDQAVVYDIKFASYFGSKRIRFGSWGRDHHIRLFNRNLVKWSEVMVHETLVLPENIRVKKINGCIHHYSVTGMNEYDKKNTYYARLSAKKYYRAGKKANLVKVYFSPAFGFFKNYIIYLGFLDGRAGWNIASSNFRHTRLKYFYLGQMENSGNMKQGVKESFVVEY
jgi:glycosyltransferase involved in cell wall biosynthesis